MSEGGIDVNDRLLKIMSILYCQGIAADFRKPVEILYPNMAANYLSIIKDPMDLGTLLLECMKGTATVKSIRDGLKLVFMNSIRFNAGAPMMEAISRHLESFASGLFEEILHVPFYESSSSDNFPLELIKKRTYRLVSVSRLPLRDTEVRAIANCVLSVMNDAPQELSPAIERMMKKLERYFLQWGALPTEGSVAPVLTMGSIFLDIVEDSRQVSPADESSTSGTILLPA
jgi:Bromodomain